MSGCNFSHFTGKKGGSKTKPKNHVTKRQKWAERKRHGNKYKPLAEKRRFVYNHKDKRFRQLPLDGVVGETIKAGLIALFHGRRYVLMEDTELKVPGMLGCFELIQ